MSQEQRDLLAVLRSELNFLEQGGYGRSASTPWKWTSTFQHSPSCINFNRPQPTRPCTECPLIDFVPSAARTQDVPCHHIQIGPAGETVGTMEREYDVLELEEALGNWLRTTIDKLERKRDGALGSAA
jgi:hypothetical protein